MCIRDSNYTDTETLESTYATSDAVDDLNTRVTVVEGDAKALTGVAGLNSRVTTLEDTVSTTTKTLTAIDTQVKDNEANIAANDTEIAMNRSDIDAIEVDYLTSSALGDYLDTDELAAMYATVSVVSGLNEDVVAIEADYLTSTVLSGYTDLQDGLDALSENGGALSNLENNFFFVDDGSFTVGGISSTYETLEDAMEALAEVRLAPGTTLTVEIEDDITLSETLVFDHPDGQRITIDGNGNTIVTDDIDDVGLRLESGSVLGGLDNVILSCAGTTGVFVEDGSSIGMDGVTIDGCSDYGVLIRNGSQAVIDDLVITDTNRSFWVEYGSTVYIGSLGLDIETTGNWNLYVSNGASLVSRGAVNSTTTSGAGRGILLQYGGSVVIDNDLSTNGFDYGATADSASDLVITGTHSSTGNRLQGVSSGTFSRYYSAQGLDVTGLTGSSNYQILAGNGGFVYAGNVSADSNGLGTLARGGGFMYLFQLNADGSTTSVQADRAGGLVLNSAGSGVTYSSPSLPAYITDF